MPLRLLSTQTSAGRGGERGEEGGKVRSIAGSGSASG